MQKKFFFYMLIFCQNLNFSQSIKGFRIPDSLKQKSFGQLEKSFEKQLYNNTDKADVVYIDFRAELSAFDKFFHLETIQEPQQEINKSLSGRNQNSFKI